MKTKITMLLALLLALVCTAAYAQEYYTLPEIREQAAAGWHETYTDKFGRSISVDIEVDVYGKDTAPVLQVTFPSYQIDKSLLDEDAELRQQIDLITIKKNNPHRTISSNKMKKGETRHTVFRSDGESVDLDKAYGAAYGSDLTLSEMFDQLVMMLDQQGIPSENFMFEKPCLFEVPCKMRIDTGEAVTPAFFNVQLWRQMYGLPYLTHASRTFEKPGWPSSDVFLDFSMGSSDEYLLMIRDIEETEMLADDIPLCSFDKVINTVEEEIEAGYVRKVFSVRFGYVLYNDPKAPERGELTDIECFYGVPSWVVECIYVKNPKDVYDYEKWLKEDPEVNERNVMEYRMLIINAQSGKMLDVFDKSKNGWGNADYVGFTSWDKVR